jgi:hypothetical protein
VVWATDIRTGKRIEASWVFRLPDPNAPKPAEKPAAAPPVVAASVVTIPGAAGGSPKR